ncbi:MAG TPA: MATE family efflux transporter [Bacillota bacterium]|jgi:multidrug efflux pump|nr:MATE family efflux transporter [Bacillota bacterium]HOL10408.1 MATE family efflux transporter [Bacillota bacterium]HPO96777.1 MATE family efflux transporter [Bacillota bacterium]
MNEEREELFLSAPVVKAVLALMVPTVISQLITVVYNMADTFFIGQLNDPNQVAAASLAMPLLIFLGGIANLFGIGASSLISRSLGAGDREKARKTAAFSIWMTIMVSFLYGIFLLLFRYALLPAIGANVGTYEYCYQYVFWTVIIGAIPTVLNSEFAHLVRAEGYSRQASFGVILGGVLNIILDPIFISGLKLEIVGAAIATMLSNLCATAYFLILIYRRRKISVISLNPKYFTLKQRIPSEVFFVGLPSWMMNLMGVLSNVVLNVLIASYSNEAMAGIGIAKKIDVLVFAIAIGISQGVLPLIGYNYAARNYQRMRAVIKTTFGISLLVSGVGTILLFTGAGPIVKAFIKDPETVRYGQLFQRIMCITGPCISITMIIITIFQSVGKKVQPMVLSLFRKGGLDVPIMILMARFIGINGITWATPISDLGAMLIAIILFIPFWKQQKAFTLNNTIGDYKTEDTR